MTDNTPSLHTLNTGSANQPRTTLLALTETQLALLGWAAHSVAVTNVHRHRMAADLHLKMGTELLAMTDDADLVESITAQYHNLAEEIRPAH